MHTPTEATTRTTIIMRNTTPTTLPPPAWMHVATLFISIVGKFFVMKKRKIERRRANGMRKDCLAFRTLTKNPLTFTHLHPHALTHSHTATEPDVKQALQDAIDGKKVLTLSDFFEGEQVRRL